MDVDSDEEFFNKATTEKLAEALFENMKSTYARRLESISQRAFPVIKQVYETQGNRYVNIAIPITDGRRMLNLSVNLQKAYENGGKEIGKALSKTIVLFEIDRHWKEHLREMDDLKQSVQNASYEQKDPLLIYKFESFNLFSSMLESLNIDALSFLLRAGIALREDAPRQAAEPRKQDMSRMTTSRTDLVTNSGAPKVKAPIRVDKTVGRNDPCPCGSGKKYKNCHGKQA